MFLFTEDCVLGNEMIDEDHKHLFDLINQGSQLKLAEFEDRYDQIRALLGELSDYADSHFAREEAYMQGINDPELILQRVQHESFRAMIWEKSFKNLDDIAEQQEVLDDLMNFLATWLLHHIIGSDMMIGKLPPLEEWMLRENPCEFTEEYRMGHILIDTEHEMLFEIAGRAFSIVRDGVEQSDLPAIIDILEELKSYTVNHFQDEEEYMESIQYAGIEAQKRAHAAFIAEFDEIDIHKIEKQPQEYMQQLLEFLVGWLVNHILKMDKQIPVYEA